MLSTVSQQQEGSGCKEVSVPWFLAPEVSVISIGRWPLNDRLYQGLNSLVIWKTKLSGMLGGVKRGSTVYPGNEDIELTVCRSPKWRVRHAGRITRAQATRFLDQYMPTGGRHTPGT